MSEKNNKYSKSRRPEWTDKEDRPGRSDRRRTSRSEDTRSTGFKHSGRSDNRRYDRDSDDRRDRRTFADRDRKHQFDDTRGHSRKSRSDDGRKQSSRPQRSFRSGRNQDAFAADENTDSRSAFNSSGQYVGRPVTKKTRPARSQAGSSYDERTSDGKRGSRPEKRESSRNRDRSRFERDGRGADRNRPSRRRHSEFSGNDEKREFRPKRRFEDDSRASRPERRRDDDRQRRHDGSSRHEASRNRRPESQERGTHAKRSSGGNEPLRRNAPKKKPSTFVPAKPEPLTLDKPVRINKALASAGIASRRAADELVMQGAVSVNGVVASEPGIKVVPATDCIEVNGERVVFDTKVLAPVYIILNKPVQTVCTASDPEGRTTVLDILPEEYKKSRIFPVGRLDFFSTGLLLLTNDGELTHRLTHPKWHQNKVYRVRTRGEVPEAVLEKFRNGMTLEEGEKLAPVECKILAQDGDTTRVEMILTQGINRQIRRMFRDVGITILNLHRVRIGPIQIGELGKGESRALTEKEISLLYQATGLSEK